MPSKFSPANNPFMGARTGISYDEADAVLFGAPHGTPYRDIDNTVYAATTDALREALIEDFPGQNHWDFDLEGPPFDDKDFKFADAGDLRTSSHDGPGNRELIRQTAEGIVKAGAVPIMVGGDDSTPIPFIEGLASAGPLTIVQVDAHIDWRDERYGELNGFSSTMRRASEMAHVERIIQVGIRGVGSARREEVEIARKWGAQIITARTVFRDGIGAVMAHVPEGANCMITLDCDALDPAIMPAVMALTPGGLTYTQVIDLVDTVVGKANLVAFDLIEFIAERDPNGAAAITAARIIANAVGRLAQKR